MNPQELFQVTIKLSQGWLLIIYNLRWKIASIDIDLLNSFLAH